MKIKVSNCQDCKFLYYNEECDDDYCNLDKNIYGGKHGHLPSNSVHKNCPLLTEPIIIEYEQHTPNRNNIS